MQLPKRCRIIFKNRIFYIIILFLTIYLFCIYYAENVEKHIQYPSIEAIMTNYTEGEEVYVSGTIVKINNNGSFIITDYYHKENIYFTIDSPSSSVHLKDEALIYGILKPSYTVKSIKVTITNRFEYFGVMIRSLLGLIILVLYFNRYWKFNIKKLLFIRRK